MIFPLFFPLIGFVGNGVLLGYILYKNPRSPLSRQYFFICFFFIMYAAAEFFSKVSQNLSLALWTNNFIMTAISFLPSTFLHFALVFTQKKKILSRWTTYVWLYLPPIIFVLLTLFTDLINVRQPIRIEWGYYQEAGSAFLTILAYVIIYCLAALYLCWKFYRTTPKWREKQQAKYFLIGTIVPVLFGAVIDGTLPLFNISFFTQVTVACSIFTTIMVIYAIQKYGFLTLTPQLAAETIVRTIPDFLLVLDKELNISLANSKILEALSYQREDLQNKSLETILADGSEAENLKKAIKESPQNNYAISYLAKNQEKIPVSLNSFPLKEQDGRILGVVVVGRDMREIQTFIRRLKEDGIALENKNKELEKLNQELKSKYQDIEQMNRLMTDRELKMVELKKEIADLKKKPEAHQRVTPNI